MVKVSVICCTYNRAQFIAKTVKQLKQQTLTDIEFIIVDDGSTDDSIKLLKKHVSKDKRFVILHHDTNKGPSASRNLALSKAKGEYIGFLDTDDDIPSDYFEKMYSATEGKDVDIVYTLYNNTRHRTDKKVLFSLVDRLMALKNGAIWDKLFKASKVKWLRFKEGYLCADNLFLIDVINHTANMYLIDGPRYSYNLQSDSVSTSTDKQAKRKQHILEISKCILDRGSENHYNEAETEELKIFLRRTFNVYFEDQKWKKTFYSLVGNNQEETQTTKVTSMRLGLLKFLRFFHLISKKSYNEKRAITLVSQSELFDKKWYLAQNPDVRAKRIKAAKHYVKYGWKEGRNPSPKFDGNAYLRDNYDVGSANMCPLVHYILNGAREGRAFVGINASSLNVGMQYMHTSLSQKIKDVLTYPVRVKAEYDRLNEEIKRLSRK